MPRFHSHRLRKNVRDRAREREEPKTLHQTPVRDVSEVVDAEIFKHPGHEVNVFTAPPRVKPKSPFALLFFQTLTYYLMRDELGIVEVKILFKLLELTDSENIIVNLSQRDLAEQIGVVQSSVSRSMKKLYAIKFLLKTPGGSVVINPQLMTRTNLRKAKETDAYSLIQALVADRSKQIPNVYDNY